MIVLFIVIMLIWWFFYNKDKQTIKEEIDTANITQSINEITVNKIEIKDLKLSDNISYIIFNPATNRDWNTDISKKTVGELKEYLSSNLIKLKTSPDKLKLIAWMIIRIFSVNDKKTLSDFSVKDFVLWVK
jgi:ATP-dependent Zn protease